MMSTFREYMNKTPISPSVLGPFTEKIVGPVVTHSILLLPHLILHDGCI